MRRWIFVCGLAAVAVACERPANRFETRLRALEGVAIADAPLVPQFDMESPYPGSLRLDNIESSKDVRRALVGRDALTVRWTIHPPKGSRIEFGVASKPRSRLVGYSVRGGRPGALKELVVNSTPSKAPWIEMQVPLDGADGSTYVVEISVRAPDGRAVIAEPALLGPVSATKPNVLVYVIDCLRADRVGAFGSTRRLSPSIDSLARESIVLEQAWSCASWTKPSVACMFTGRYPPRHGARTVPDRIVESAPTLAEAFARAGYATRAVVANPVLDADNFGFGRGFRSYRNLARDYTDRAVNATPADAKDITDDVISWLPSVASRPFFLYLHSLDLHYPYLERATPGQPKLPPNASESDLYDSEFAYNDHEIGRLLEALKQADRLKDTIVVVTADHGEEFRDHGNTRHGHSLYQELVHVPLIVRLPGGARAGTRVAEPISLIDLPATLLALAGLPALQGADGVSVAPRLRGEAAVADRPLPLFAEQISPVETIYAARDESYKAVENLVPNEESLLFDLRADPLEKASTTESSSRTRALRRALADFMAQAQQGLHVVFDADADDAQVQVTLRSAAGFQRVYRMGQRTGEPLKILPDLKSATYDFHRAGVDHRLVAVPKDPALPVELRIQLAGKSMDPKRVCVGSGLQLHGAIWSFSPASVPRAVGASDACPIHIWYQAAPAGARTEDLDPKLREELKALGYIK